MVTPSRAEVFHFLNSQPCTLQEAVAEALHQSGQRSRELIELGAVYCQNQRCTNPEQILSEGAYLRIHSNPIRYNLADFADETRIIEECEDLLIVFKPAGLPCIPRVDNLHENLLSLVGAKIGRTVHITHRLDIPTSGIMALALTKPAQSEFNQLLVKRQIEKIYRVQVEGHCEQTGLVEHWMKPSDHSPKEVTTEPIENYLNCRLTILSHTAINNDSELSIRLETGRTHQIRAQMSALGHPIKGDTLYGAKPSEAPLGLQAKSLRFEWKNQPRNFQL